MSHLYPLYPRPDITLVRGEGSRVWDDRGRVYVDLIGGIAVSALGHAHPRILAAIEEQAGRLLHGSNLFHHPWQEPLAARLAALTGLSRVFFCNSGSESVEAALKLSRARAKGRGEPRRVEFVALEGSFHGRTAGALSVTSNAAYRAPFEPLLPGVTFIPPEERALAAAMSERTAALLVEPIQGEGGVRVLPDSFLRAAREACDEAGALLIADEIQCGLGRTGDWFAYQRAKILPDLVCIAKPLACGLPLGALIGREETAEFFGPGAHGSTFGGGPLACRVGIEFLSVVQEEGLLEKVRIAGERATSALRAAASRCPAILDVRGRGLMIGVEIDRPATAVLEALRERGWLAGSSRQTVIRLLPPFMIEPELFERFAADLEVLLGADAASFAPSPLPAAPARKNGDTR